MSISAKSAASTPPAPERIVMTASRSSSSLIWVRSESRSVTWRTDSMVERRSLSSSAKSTATTSQTSRLLPKSRPGARLDGDVYRATEGRENGGCDRDVGGAPQTDDRRLPVRTAGAIGQNPRGDAMGPQLNGQVLRRGLTHRGVADLHRRPQAAPVCRPAVQRVRGVQRGSVGGIEHPGTGQLNRGHVDAAADEHERDDGEPDDEQADLTPFALFGVDRPAPRGRSHPSLGGAAQTTPDRLHRCPPKRSTVARWVADTGICNGTIAAKNVGTKGIGTQSVAVIWTRPSGRRQGVPSHPIWMLPSDSNPWSAKASPAAE